MYVRPISTRFSRGRLMPAMRAIRLLLALPLLVTRVRADHHDGARPTDRPALLAHRLDARPDLHDSPGCSVSSAARKTTPPVCVPAAAQHAAAATLVAPRHGSKGPFARSLGCRQPRPAGARTRAV